MKRRHCEKLHNLFEFCLTSHHGEVIRGGRNIIVVAEKSIKFSGFSDSSIIELMTIKVSPKISPNTRLPNKPAASATKSVCIKRFLISKIIA